jgi:hypothetical protein
MAMQYDVLSYHNTVSGVAVPYRTRLKGIVISPSASSTFHVGVFNNTFSTGTYVQSASTTITVTLTAHGLNTGDTVYLNCTTGTGDSNVYSITKTGDNTFTVVSPTSETTSGNVNVYKEELLEIDCATGTSFYTLIPGEGIVGQDGLYVGLPSAGTVTSTIFYG